MLVAYASIVLLTGVLVVLNIHSGFREYNLHRYRPRLASQVVAVGLVGSMLITISYYVLDRTMDAALSVQEETLVHQTPALITKV